MRCLDDLQQDGTLRWRAEDQAWIADPEHVVKALTNEGFDEYRREVASAGRARAAGGMWQGLDRRTGVVATVIWVARAAPQPSQVFIEIDGRRVEGSAWAEIDADVLDTLAAAREPMTLAEIARRVAMSEDAVRSIVSMLAEQGQIRIVAVELLGERGRGAARAADVRGGERLAS
jgi:hypothetical protein